MFCGTEWKTKQKALDNALVAIKDKIAEPGQSVDDLATLNSLMKQLQVIDLITKKWREVAASADFFALMDTQKHFLSATPVVELNFPNFLNKKKVEFSVANADLSATKLEHTLGKTALLAAGYTEEKDLSKFQIELLQEVVVHISRDCTEVEKSLLETADPLAGSGEMTNDSQKQLKNLVILRSENIDALTIENMHEVEAALFACQERTSLMCALAMFQNGRTYIDRARAKVKILREVQKNSDNVKNLLVSIKEAQAVDGAKAHDLFSQVITTVASCEKASVEKIVELNADAMVDASRSVCQIYGTACFSLLRKTLDGEKTVMDWYTENTKAWDEAIALGCKWINKGGDFLPNATLFRDATRSVMEIMNKLRQAVEMKTADVGTKDTKQAMQLYHWFNFGVQKLLAEDAALKTYLQQDDVFAKVVALFDGIDEGINKALINPGVTKHFSDLVQNSVRRFEELLDVYASDMAKPLLPPVTALHLGPEDGREPQEQARALGKYLEKATKCEVPMQLQKTLEEYGEMLGDATELKKVKKGVEFAQKMNATFSSGAQLCKILCGRDLNSHDTWMITEQRIDLVAKLEERANDVRKFVADHSPAEFVPSDDDILLNSWMFEVEARTRQLLSSVNDLTTSWKTRWATSFDQMMDQLDVTRPRPNMEKILYSDQKAILMQPEKLLKLNPITRVVQELVTTMKNKISILPVVSQERLNLADRSRKEADACLGVAFVIAALDEQLPLYKTADEKTSFKKQLLEHAKSKAFDMPECLLTELQRPETADPTGAATIGQDPAAPEIGASGEGEGAGAAVAQAVASGGAAAPSGAN